MSGRNTRIRTIQALLDGHHCIFNSPDYPILRSEFLEVHHVRKIRRDSRRRLLEVLHSVRGLDTVLKTVVSHHGCQSNGKTPNSMGSYLYALRDHSVATIGNINNAQRLHFQSRIVNKRNLYLHQAGTFPQNDNEVSVLLSDIQSCISTVVAL